MKNFYSEMFCPRQGTCVRQTQCLHCTWFAVGTDAAIAIAERAHKCYARRELCPEGESGGCQ